MASKLFAICCIFMLITHEINSLPISEPLYPTVAVERPTATAAGFYEENIPEKTAEQKKKDLLCDIIKGCAIGAAVVGAAGAAGAAGYAGYKYHQNHKANTTIVTGTIDDSMPTQVIKESYGAKIAGTMDPNTK
jgi:hypothetical protein